VDKTPITARVALEHPEVTYLWPRGPRPDWAKKLLAFMEWLSRQAANDPDVSIRELASIIARGIGDGRS
jgi:hypothetical protein